MSVTDLIDIVGAVLFWTILIWNFFSVRDTFLDYAKYKNDRDKNG